MYAVVVEATFSATHRLRGPDGIMEPLHGHDWVVRARFARAELDPAGMVVDFVQAQQTLAELAGKLHHRDLNAHPAFAGHNPTAETVARHFFDQLRDHGLDTVRAVDVTEAPGCVAMYSEEWDGR